MKYYSHDRRDYIEYRRGSGGTVEILDLVVGSQRRCGIGKSLVYRVLQECPPGTKLVWAITRANNFIAQHFYEALHFRVVAVLRNFYKEDPDHDTVDAIMYGRDL